MKITFLSIVCNEYMHMMTNVQEPGSGTYSSNIGMPATNKQWCVAKFASANLISTCFGVCRRVTDGPGDSIYSNSLLLPTCTFILLQQPSSSSQSTNITQILSHFQGMYISVLGVVCQLVGGGSLLSIQKPLPTTSRGEIGFSSSSIYIYLKGCVLTRSSGMRGPEASKQPKGTAYCNSAEMTVVAGSSRIKFNEFRTIIHQGIYFEYHF